MRMVYEDKYPNLHFHWVGGGHRKLILDKIPPSYAVFDPMGQRKAHIVPESRVYEAKHRPWEEARGICGTETQERCMNNKIMAKHVCESCMKKLNNQMERYLWDEHNQEYYDPMEV